MIRGPCHPASRASSGLEEPTPMARIQALLDHIRALDKSMDKARRNKIETIKKALADGTYHVSPAEVASKILENMQEALAGASGCHPCVIQHARRLV
jgi:hypothetical protein